MTDMDYINFFNDCLNHNMTIKKYIPIKEYIFKIFDYFKSKDNFNRIDDDSKREFSYNMLKLFDRIIDENKNEDLDEYIDFLIYINANCWSFIDLLNVIVFKEDSYPKISIEEYYHYLSIIFDVVIGHNNNEMLEEFYGHSRFSKMTRLFMRNYKNPYDFRNTNYEIAKRNSYYDIGVGVIGDIYNTDLDLASLELFLHDLVYDYENIMTYLELNGLLRDYESTYGIEHAYETLKEYDNKKKLLKQVIV